MISDTLWRTMRRSAPAIDTPAVNASLTAQSRPNKTKATKIERSVSAVRSFLRFKLLQTNEKNFMAETLFCRFGGQLAFIQMDCSRGAGGRVRIVRDHQDGF